MPYALETRTEESPPAAADGFAVSDLWMLPLLLFQLILEKFSRHLSRLKQMRRTRPMPKDWRSFYPDLRTSEWAVRMFCFEGARQIILGQDLDLQAISFDLEPPEDFQPPMPRSALAMHQRLEDLARFHADPERYIRRHAARIAGRDHERDSDRNRDHDHDWNRNPGSDLPVALPLAVALAVPLAVPVAIRGPPRPAHDCRLPTADCPAASPPGTRPRAPTSFKPC